MSTFMIGKQEILDWLKKSAAVIEQQKSYLTDLDSPIGDADHGIIMDRGFKKVLTKLPSVEDKDIGTILKTTGMALISSVGGAAGPLYGTFFLDAAKSIPEKEELDVEDLVNLFESGLTGIKRIGKANGGDKTIIDAFEPALEELRRAAAENKPLQDSLESMSEAARKGMQSTIPMVARKGRASYVGERSAGHQDPGATSTYYLIHALLDVVKEK